MGRRVQKRGGAFIAFDVLIDKRFDLDDPVVEAVLQEWLGKGMVWGFWLGTDCTTWSRASWSPGGGWFNSYRNQLCLWGALEKLRPKAAERVKEGNRHVKFSLRMLEIAAKTPSIVAGMENPAGSVMWLLPEVLGFEARYPNRVFRTTCHYCQYGKPWKKPTTFLWVGGDKGLAPQKKCENGKGKVCGRTGQPHSRLGGGRLQPQTGKRMTKVAEPYPPKLAEAMVCCLAGRPPKC